MTPATAPHIVRVLPDVAAIDRAFDYSVPAEWMFDDRSRLVEVGSMVRIDLHGRRVAGWILETSVEPPPGVELKPLAKISGAGPPSDVMDLAKWAAWRWAGRWSKLLKIASPSHMVRELVAPGSSRIADGPPTGLEPAFDRPVTVLRHPPNAPRAEAALSAARRGPTLIVAPSVDVARSIANDLHRAGADVALVPRDWAKAASGGRVVVGARNAVWAPIPDATSLVVLDEHDESLQDERNPTWHARDVAVERARRLDIPCVLVSPSPSLDALRIGPLMKPPRSVERESWPALTIIDRRDDDPVKSSLLTEAVVPIIREVDNVVCVLNRRGRARLLACANCGELVRCRQHEVPLRIDEATLVCPIDGEERPVVCDVCSSITLKNLRAGVTRVSEDLEALAKRSVTTLDGPAAHDPATASGLMIGTEAALHRIGRAEAVIFLDFDQELLAPRYRANEQAFALLVRAARLVGPRSRHGRLMVQTRQPDHIVLDAALHGDPARLAHFEAEKRRSMSRPPYSAEALISGSAGSDYVDGLRGRIDLEVRGPLDHAWLVRAADHQELCDALAAVPEPKGRYRVEVDPLRI